MNKIIKCQSIIRSFLVRKNFKIIELYYNTYLKNKNVKLPKKNSGFWYALSYLYQNKKKEIYIEDIKKYVLRHGIKLTGGDSLQIRHLGLQYGFNILKGNEINPITNKKIKKSHYMLLNLTTCHPAYICDKRQCNITKNEWNVILKEYDYKCACCGNKEGEPMRYNKYMICKLQQGHMNPLKSLTCGNVILQCKNCNQQYKNKAIFNKRGYIINFNKNGFI